MRITDLSESKSTKSEANYQNKPHAGQRCVNCTMWRDPNKCSAVAGNISPDGWCDWWAAGAYGKHGDSIDESEILDEGWRENLRKLVTVGALGLSVAAGITSKLQYDKWIATHPQAIQAIDTGKATSLAHPQSSVSKTTAADQQVDPLSKLRPKPRPSNQEVGQEADPLSKIRPKPRPTDLEVDQEVDQEVDPLSKLRPHKRPVDSRASHVEPDEKPKPSLDNLGPLSKKLHDELIKAGITGDELVAFMAQSAHETAMFTSLYEDGGDDPAYFDKYEYSKILGNEKEGDGFKYRGRGYLHLTGRWNYQNATNKLGYDFINNPDLVADPDIAAEVAIWFWKNRVAKSKPDFTDVLKVTHRINPNLQGLDDRRAKYNYISTMVKDFKIDTMHESVYETIHKIGDDKWRLYSKDGNKNLGTFGSLEAAKKHEREVQYFKHADESVDENFKDGKNPGRKGLAKRSGVNTKASVTDLRNTAKHSTGEKQRMAHWLANMKSGRQKASESQDQPRYTASEWAVIEGGHSLEEQKKDKLFGWMINTDKDI